jgi:hypothetical protein
MLNAKLLRTIWAVARERHISGEEVHEAIQAGFSKQSLRELTSAEACQLLDGMRGKRREAGSWARGQAQAYAGRKKAPVNDPEYLVNETELALLAKTAGELGMSSDRLAEFCTRQIKVAAPRVMREFNKVFWALKAMQRRRAHA